VAQDDEWGALKMTAWGALRTTGRGGCASALRMTGENVLGPRGNRANILRKTDGYYVLLHKNPLNVANLT
jgi:hypothetical protein